MENQINNMQQNKELEENSIDIRELLFVLVNRWWIFLISVVVCAVAAFLFAKTQTPIYQESAMILIRDEKAGGSSEFGSSALFGDLGVFGKGLVLENEIYILQSTPLMSSVVEKLNLQVSYQQNTTFRKKDLYGATPIHFTLLNKLGQRNNLSIVASVSILDSNTYAYLLEIPSQKLELEGVADFNQIIALNDDNSFSIEKTDLYTDEFLNKEIKISVTPTDKRAKSLLANLSVSRPDKVTGILNLSIKDSNPLRAKRVLDTLIAVYNADAIADKNKIAQNTEDFIINRIRLISGELEDVDERVASLKQSTQVTDYAVASNLALTSGLKYTEEVLAVETELSMVKYMKRYLEDPAKKDDLIPANVGIADAGVQSLITNYNTQKLEYDKILNNSGANNPTTKNLYRALEATREAVVRSVDNLLETVKIKRNSLLQQEKLSQSKISNMPTQEKEVTDVLRQQKIKESLYLYLLNKREENALTLAVTESNAKIVESANGTGVPIVPRTMIYVLVGVVLGIVIPFVYIFLWEFFNTKVRSRVDVEKAINVPVIGEIPEKPKGRENDDIVVFENGNDSLTEAFRMLHSNIHFFMNEPSQKVIQLISTVPGEGKSYSALNFSLSLAFLGKKTIVVDLDLRKRSLSKMMAPRERNGVMQYFIGKEDNISNIISHSTISPNLDYIVCEKTPPNPTQLLLTDKYEKLIEYLKRHYDYVIIDSTPAQFVADAVIINKCADMSLYVARIGVLDKRYLPNIQELADSNKFKNMAMLLIAVPMGKKIYGYRYGYAYSYGYGYGYGYGEESEA